MPFEEDLVEILKGDVDKLNHQQVRIMYKWIRAMITGVPELIHMREKEIKAEIQKRKEEEDDLPF